MRKVLVAVVVLIAGLLVVASLQPGEFSVQRKVVINAPPEKIYPFLVDFRQWPAWSPWEKLDPDMKRTLSGPSSGPGAAYAWNGSSKVGAGRMEIVSVAPPSKASIKLDFLEPFEAHNVTDFNLVPQGAQTEVTWLMRGPAPFVSKLMGLFVSMDSMIGKDFETGLANLKAAAEK